ncbi:Clavaminate synthase-like protein [Cercospora beticola]|uniref:Clavaminate synthase-like protein n=1 Tax=Cercospora beticola TaxID=122368 RepID=A0A2G5IE00_CERBT|nr:Clavaminate synthase-like protein [Cercospora beticola]PIB02970.1 Clavaminate synthase-like protein [Cercospora beticola]WPB04379.1 hypothetical protein RHO25_009025 [Cercospora beticola]
MAIDSFWTPVETNYQKHVPLEEQSLEASVTFPLVVRTARKCTKEALLREISTLASRHHDENAVSPLRKLLDAHGGAIQFRELPLHSPEDFSEFLEVLAGDGPYAWKPHTHRGSEVLRKPLAKHVMTANEGPPSHYIGWHNEYSMSPAHPAYVVLYCQEAPTSGGETSLVNGIALHDRMRNAEPEFVQKSIDSGIAYKVPHTAVQRDGTLGGAGVYKSGAFGPPDDAQNESWKCDMQDTPENRKGVEDRIRQLAREGGWDQDHSQTSGNVPAWQQKGFDWTWNEDGGLEVLHRMPGVRVHPTQNVPALFNSLSTRYHNAKKYNTFEPPFTYRDDDGVEKSFWPPHFAGHEKDEPIPRTWLATLDKYQKELASDVQWHTGDVLIVDNFAVQHARWSWTGSRKVLASFWDQPSLKALPVVQ